MVLVALGVVAGFVWAVFRPPQPTGYRRPDEDDY